MLSFRDEELKKIQNLNQSNVRYGLACSRVRVLSHHIIIIIRVSTSLIYRRFGNDDIA